ncbi:MAG TPA: ATP synthase F1 subunit delta [Acidimicrobiia bacterium]|nr:ATP synthase F1 subunit delta [Acidimicrobiia bacterium]
MSDRVEAYANAFLEVARAEGYLTDIEDELYRFARAFESFDDLRMALTDQALPAERRIAVIEELMGGKALPASIALAGMVVAAGRAHDLPVIVDRFVSEAAQERDQEVAEVRSAVPLDAGQQQRLAAALARATGKQVEIKVVIDPTVLGGIVARVGDVVIDGSVRHRLEQLKEQI